MCLNKKTFSENKQVEIECSYDCDGYCDNAITFNLMKNCLPKQNTSAASSQGEIILFSLVLLSITV